VEDQWYTGWPELSGMLTYYGGGDSPSLWTDLAPGDTIGVEDLMMMITAYGLTYDYDFCAWNIEAIFSHAWLMELEGVTAFLHESSFDDGPIGDNYLVSFRIEVVSEPVMNYYFQKND
jgi:hypothetical protein